MKVLVADDDMIVVSLLTAGLRKRGFEVETASDTMQIVMNAMRTSPDVDDLARRLHQIFEN